MGVKTNWLHAWWFFVSWNDARGSTKATRDYTISKHPPLLPTILKTPSPIRSASCVPIPRAAQPSGSPTPTLFPMAPDRPRTSHMPDLAPSVTPRAYANIADLSPEVPLQDKWETIVFRCNGTFDKFLAGPGVEVDQFLKLEPGDVVINTIPPASLMGQEPPEP
jgi:hypothetical protein